MEHEIAIELVINTPANIKVLQELSAKTFIETFGAQNTVANMQLYLSECLSYRKVVEEMCNPHSSFYFATIVIDQLGYLKLNTGQAQTETLCANGLEIERIYVLKKYQGRKVGQLLLDRAMKIAKSYNKQYVWLGVWENNKKAIRFYEKNGFVPFGAHHFKLGEDEQTDIMMKIDLS